MMLYDGDIDAFVESAEFEEMLSQAKEDDRISYKSDIACHTPAKAIIFSKTNELWKSLRSTYKGDFAELVYGELPDEKAIIDSLSRIAALTKGFS